MKSFLEEYGFAILSAIVVIILILIISPVGATIMNSFKSTINLFDDTSNGAFSSLSGIFDTKDDKGMPLPTDNQRLHIVDAGEGTFYGGGKRVWFLYDNNANQTVDFSCPYDELADEYLDWPSLYGHTISSYSEEMDGNTFTETALWETLTYEHNPQKGDVYRLSSNNMFIYVTGRSGDWYDVNYYYGEDLTLAGDPSNWDHYYPFSYDEFFYWSFVGNADENAETDYIGKNVFIVESGWSQNKVLIVDNDLWYAYVSFGTYNEEADDWVFDLSDPVSSRIPLANLVPYGDQFRLDPTGLTVYDRHFAVDFVTVVDFTEENFSFYHAGSDSFIYPNEIWASYGPQYEGDYRIFLYFDYNFDGTHYHGDDNLLAYYID